MTSQANSGNIGLICSYGHWLSKLENEGMQIPFHPHIEKLIFNNIIQVVLVNLHTDAVISNRLWHGPHMHDCTWDLFACVCLSR